MGGAVREAYAEEVDEVRDRSLARVGSTTAQRAMAAKEAVAKRAETRAQPQEGRDGRGRRAVGASLPGDGRRVLKRTQEG